LIPRYVDKVVESIHRFSTKVIGLPVILEGWLCAFYQWVQLVTDILIRTVFAQI
jgi:hypothetical protein